MAKFLEILGLVGNEGFPVEEHTTREGFDPDILKKILFESLSSNSKKKSCAIICNDEIVSENQDVYQGFNPIILKKLLFASLNKGKKTIIGSLNRRQCQILCREFGMSGHGTTGQIKSKLGCYVGFKTYNRKIPKRINRNSKAGRKKIKERQKRNKEKKKSAERAVFLSENEDQCPVCLVGKLFVLKSAIPSHNKVVCKNFPACEFQTRNLDCPKCKTGTLLERQRKSSKSFFGCSCFPECTFARGIVIKPHKNEKDKTAEKLIAKKQTPATLYELNVSFGRLKTPVRLQQTGVGHILPVKSIPPATNTNANGRESTPRVKLIESTTLEFNVLNGRLREPAKLQQIGSGHKNSVQLIAPIGKYRCEGTAKAAPFVEAKKTLKLSVPVSGSQAPSKVRGAVGAPRTPLISSALAAKLKSRPSLKKPRAPLQKNQATAKKSVSAAKKTQSTSQKISSTSKISITTSKISSSSGVHYTFA